MQQSGLLGTWEGVMAGATPRPSTSMTSPAGGPLTRSSNISSGAACSCSAPRRTRLQIEAPC